MTHHLRLSLIGLIVFSATLSACIDLNNKADIISKPAKKFEQTPHTEFELIDQHALNAPKPVEQSLESLAAYLIEPAKNDRQKIRAIYRWITDKISYDDEGYFAGEYRDLHSQDVLTERRAVCDGYAGLVKNLGQLAGLEVVNISGYSKGYSYSVHQTNTINHAWNAVKVDGQWQLLDATWGAGYLDDQKKRFIRRFQEHYFLTPPEQFIYDHFPKAAQWQLLQHPISKKDYDNLVYLRPAFFRMGLAIDSHSQGLISATNQLVVTLRAPETATVSAKLLQNQSELDESHLSIQKKPGQYDIRATFPRPGDYVLRIFTKPQPASGDFHWALDYQIQASQAMQAAQIPVSPQQVFFETGLKVDSHPNRLIQVDKQVMVTLLAPNEALMSAIIYQNNNRLDKSLVFVQRKAGRYEIRAVFPSPGDYLLRLFAKRKEEASDSYVQALDYQVSVSQGLSGKIGFPKRSLLFKKNDGYLDRPMQRHLEAGKTYTFQLTVPTAQQVVVVIGTQSIPLKKQGGFFVGNVAITPGEVGVYALFAGEKRYGRLLQYVAD
jgi:hypothetical protein